MNIDELFGLQSRFCEKLWTAAGLDPTTPEGRREILRRNVLGAHSELSEILDAEHGWKPHRSTVPVPGPGRNATLEEIVDVTKFLLGIAVAYGYSPDEFARMYSAKSALVEARFDEEKEIGDLRDLGRPVAVIRAEGLLYDSDATLDAFYTGSGGRVGHRSLPPREVEALREKLFSYEVERVTATLVPGLGMKPLAKRLAACFDGRLVVASDAPDVVGALPGLRDYLSHYGIERRAVFVGPDPVVITRVLPVEVYADTDPAAANRAGREGVSRAYAVGDERVRRGCSPYTRWVPTWEALVESEEALCSFRAE